MVTTTRAPEGVGSASSVSKSTQSGKPGAAQLRLDTLLCGESEAMHSTKRLIARVAASRASTVLVTGESGTGKDVAAHLLHELSPRAAGPFVNITCSALPEALLESELFGHERGAFTDARQRKLGLLETAQGGTVFLDEVGEMPAALQAKLLRFLEDRCFRRVGGVSDVQSDARVVAATHRDLQRRVVGGLFREDLYYRLSVLHVHLPALRERGMDLALLACHFVRHFAAVYDKPGAHLGPGALGKLSQHPWRGNVRELKHVLERAVFLAERDEIGARDLTLPSVEQGPSAFTLPSRGICLERLERDLVDQALERCHGNRSRAAALLGLTRDQIRHRIAKFGLSYTYASED